MVVDDEMVDQNEMVDGVYDVLYEIILTFLHNHFDHLPSPSHDQSPSHDNQPSHNQPPSYEDCLKLIDHSTSLLLLLNHWFER